MSEAEYDDAVRALNRMGEKDLADIEREKSKAAVKVERIKSAAEWQPIETAPKDGTFIILGYAGSHVSEGRWVSDPSRNHWRETGWFDTDADVLCDHPGRPTHWMPLPEPPNA